jgi:hypothetical protein
LSLPFVLRKIRKARWLRDDIPWMPKDGIQADAFSDLKTEDNELSLFEIDDSKSNLFRVIAALASNQTNLSNFDFALLKTDAIQKAAFKVEPSKGTTFDEVVNGWHIALKELTGARLLEFAQLIKEADMRRLLPKEVKNAILESINAGNLNRDKFAENLKASLQ